MSDWGLYLVVCWPAITGTGWLAFLIWCAIEVSQRRGWLAFWGWVVVVIAALGVIVRFTSWGVDLAQAAAHDPAALHRLFHPSII